VVGNTVVIKSRVGSTKRGRKAEAAASTEAAESEVYESNPSGAASLRLQKLLALRRRRQGANEKQGGAGSEA